MPAKGSGESLRALHSTDSYLLMFSLDMNYISAIIGAVIIFALSDWLLRARKTFNVCED